MRVARCVYRSDRGVLDAEYLTLFDRPLIMFGIILVNAVRQVGVHPDQVWYSPGVVAMPMSQENVRQRNGSCVQCCIDYVGPGTVTLRGINDESMCSGAQDICVGSLECELIQRMSKAFLSGTSQLVLASFTVPFQHSVREHESPVD